MSRFFTAGSLQSRHCLCKGKVQTKPQPNAELTEEEVVGVKWLSEEAVRRTGAAERHSVAQVCGPWVSAGWRQRLSFCFYSLALLFFYLLRFSPGNTFLGYCRWLFIISAVSVVIFNTSGYPLYRTHQSRTLQKMLQLTPRIVGSKKIYTRRDFYA